MSTAGTGPRATVPDRGARRVLYAFLTTVTAVVMLLGYRTSTPSAPVATGVVAAGASGSFTTSGAATSATPGPTSTAGAATTGAGTSGAGTDGTYTGSSVATRWGPVQVQITVRGGRITAATAVAVPNTNARDVQINRAAVPGLDAEAVAAQSAAIDTVSGATLTSNGYLSSLQSALDAAGL